MKPQVTYPVLTPENVYAETYRMTIKQLQAAARDLGIKRVAIRNLIPAIKEKVTGIKVPVRI